MRSDDRTNDQEEHMDSNSQPTFQGAESNPAEQLGRVGEAARRQAYKQIDNKKSVIAGQLQGFASKLKGIGEQGQGDPVQKLAGNAAQLAQRAADAMGRMSTDELVTLGKREMSARPLMFLAGFFAVGFLSARLLR